MTISTKGFGAYDIRGTYPETINEEIAWRIGRAFPALVGAKRVAVGHDIRLSGPSLSEALVRGLTEVGCDVVDIGMCGTEMIYFVVGHEGLDGGIMITASHNPKEYNGMKFVKRGAEPVASEELLALKKAVEEFEAGAAGHPQSADADSPLNGGGQGKGTVEHRDVTEAYVDYLLSYVDVSRLRPFRVVANAGNGAAGPVLHALAERLPFDIVMVNDTPDGTFPHGVPNPLLAENREATARVVREAKADVGVAWDGDFDRCFLFDEHGTCIDGYYLVGLLAEAFLRKEPGARIIHDPRLTWNTTETVRAHGGEPVICKGGHAFIKAKMREVDAIYGGEMSSHHYFRDFYYCDSGMIPWLLVMELLSQAGGKTLSDLMAERMARYPISGEINSRVQDAEDVMARVEKRYAGGQDTHVAEWRAGGTVAGDGGTHPAGQQTDGNAAHEGQTWPHVSHLDGLTVEFPDWRFNLRRSNTEPVIRLNVETRGDRELCEKRTEELLQLIRA